MRIKALLLSLLITLSISAQFMGKGGKDEVVIKKSYITIGYNLTYNIPNYVGEKLVYSMTVGKEKRSPGFYPEEGIPTKSSDYTRSGYDRGHLAPAGDFKFDKVAMYESFSMANVAPQWPSLNRRVWLDLENKVRKLSREVDTLYVVTGTIVENPSHKLRKGNITIPTYFYKAILGMKGRSCRISCAWIYHNDLTLLGRQVTIDELERIIGRNLFIGLGGKESKILLP